MKKWYKIEFYAELDESIPKEMLHRPLSDLMTKASKVDQIRVWDVSKLSNVGAEQGKELETSNETAKSGQTSGN